jgi:hypothetical protein
LADAQGALPQFSADVVNPRGTLDKLYVGAGKIRVESSQGQQVFIGIVDLTTQNVLVLDPSQKTYREAKSPGMAATFRLLQPIDPGNPCPQLLQIIRGASPGTRLKLLECKNVGGETVNGRNTVKWVGTTQEPPAPPRTGYVWIDPSLHFILRAQDADGSGLFELRDIKEGPQPANLFEIPPGYRKTSG